MAALKLINDTIQRVFTYISVLLLSAFTVIVFMQVIMRNYFKIPVLWAQDAALACFLWSVFLGAAIGLRRRRHYIVELFPDRFIRTNKVLDLFADLIILIIIYIFIVNGFRFAQMGLTRISTSLGIPQVYFFASIPVSGVAMLLFNIENILKNIIALKHLWGGAN